jgi:hypothetical protein
MWAGLAKSTVPSALATSLVATVECAFSNKIITIAGQLQQVITFAAIDLSQGKHLLCTTAVG